MCYSIETTAASLAVTTAAWAWGLWMAVAADSWRFAIGVSALEYGILMQIPDFMIWTVYLKDGNMSAEQADKKGVRMTGRMSEAAAYLGYVLTQGQPGVLLGTAIAFNTQSWALRIVCIAVLAVVELPHIVRFSFFRPQRETWLAYSVTHNPKGRCGARCELNHGVIGTGINQTASPTAKQICKKIRRRAHV